MGEQHDQPIHEIGDLARRLGLNARTLRYYESISLPPTRMEVGYHLYSDEDERRLKFVLRAKRVGLSLDEIRRILHLGRQGTLCA